jgi:two-component system, OmpR family, sensor kinase
MKTLRGQLTAWFIGLITIIGVAASIGTGLVSFNEESGFLDDQLRQIALSVGDTPSAAGESSQIIAGADPEDHIIVHILDNNLKTVRNSDPAIDIPIENVTGFYDHVNAGIQWRTFTLIAANRVVQVSQQTELRTAAAFSSMLNTILPIALLIPLSWIFVGWVVKRLLKPLQDLAAALLARQTASNIVLSSKGIPDEVVPLVDAMNNLLVRQHELLEFRQRFISDAAHQLRTPLTALNLQMENLKVAMPDKSNAVFLGPMQTGLNRMSALLSQLLKLARADEPHAFAAMEFVNLSEIVRASLADVHEHAAAKAIDLGLTADVDVKVRGEPLDLIMLLGNLLDNAIRYTPNGGKVDVEILVSETGAQVNIRDTGPGISDSAMALVFNRFYRHNPTGTDGSGLGLSIVAALAARNNAVVKLQNRNDREGLIANVCFSPG